MYQDFRCMDPNTKPATEMTNQEGNAFPGVVCSPIMECPCERVCHREIHHEVPHVCPVNTRIINHHIYRHTFTPCYSCCEENEICNVYEPKCKC